MIKLIFQTPQFTSFVHSLKKYLLSPSQITKDAKKNKRQSSLPKKLTIQ